MPATVDRDCAAWLHEFEPHSKRLREALGRFSAAVGEEPDTVEDVVEPYLIQLGFIQRTPRGRLATERAYAHVGRAPRGRLPI